MSRRVAIIGIGLIGGSMGAALRASGEKVVGFDKDPRRVRFGLDGGLIDKGEESLAGLLQEAETVILAVPVKSIVHLLPEVDRIASPQALLIDTGSAKSEVVNVMSSLNRAQRAIGGHPLAGSERAGPKAADPQLFRNRSFVLSPSAKTDPSIIQRAKELAFSIGARPILMDPLRHDEVLARTSHLPQLIASSLIRCLDPGDAAYTGNGFRDMTRLACSDAAMWRDVLLANRAQVSLALRRYSSELDEIAGLIERADPNALQEWMERSRSLWSLQAKAGSSGASRTTESAPLVEG